VCWEGEGGGGGVDRVVLGRVAEVVRGWRLGEAEEILCCPGAGEVEEHSGV